QVLDGLARISIAKYRVAPECHRPLSGPTPAPRAVAAHWQLCARSYSRVCFVCGRWKIGMLLLLGSPPVSIGLALEAGVSARKSTSFSNVHAERAVRFRDDPIIPHAITCPRCAGHHLSSLIRTR